MPKFRYHKGSLEDSLATTIEVANKKELVRALNADFMPFGIRFKESDIVIKYYGYDERCGWDTWLVSSTNNKYRFVLGMADDNLQSN